MAAASTRRPGAKVLANSRGFVGSYRTSYAGVSAAPLAVDANGQMQRDGWWSSARRLGDLESPEAVGAEAARRTLRRLGARRVPTQRVPIVFAPEAARSLIGSVFDAASGDAIWRHASFLAGKLGETIAASALTIVDDNTMLLPTGVGGFGSSPFDGEGLPSQRTWWLKTACCATYMLNTYTARKLGMKSTHNASRGLAGAPGIGCGNLYLEPGTLTPEEIIGEVTAGLYVTSLMGFGTNMVTGDYSRGATGLWIENGATDACRGRDHDCREPGRDAAECDGDRQRPGVSRVGGFADAADRWDDDRGGVEAELAGVCGARVCFTHVHGVLTWIRQGLKNP